MEQLDILHHVHTRQRTSVRSKGKKYLKWVLTQVVHRIGVVVPLKDGFVTVVPIYQNQNNTILQFQYPIRFSQFHDWVLDIPIERNVSLVSIDGDSPIKLIIHELVQSSDLKIPVGLLYITDAIRYDANILTVNINEVGVEQVSVELPAHNRTHRNLLVHHVFTILAIHANLTTILTFRTTLNIFNRAYIDLTRGIGCFLYRAVQRPCR